MLGYLVAGIVIASVCGYMAGLIGASNSPISGVGILAVLGASLLLAAIYGSGGDEGQTQALIAYARGLSEPSAGMETSEARA